MMSLSFVLGCLIVSGACASQAVLGGEEDFGVSVESARANAPAIFNAVHSAMRQWGSSIQHNGMSMFPVTVSEGTLLYHGTSPYNPNLITNGTEWLAFEINHSELFTRFVPVSPILPPAADPEDPVLNSRNARFKWLLNIDDDDDDNMPPDIGSRVGTLQIFQTTRPLKLLYFDGMSAASCSRGTIDTQSILLLQNKLAPGDDYNIGTELCAMSKDWGVEGFLRMEAGFEVIKCDFADGLRNLADNVRPAHNSPAEFNSWSLFQYIREVAERYHGFGARVVVDYSSMVSAFFYPANLSNPLEGSPDPRLINTKPFHLAKIRADLASTMQNRPSAPGFDWQGRVVDMITARYSRRLEFLASNPPPSRFTGDISSLLNFMIDYNTTFSLEHSIDTCAKHYLLSARPCTPADQLIYAAILTVTTRICSTLFDVRGILLDEYERKLQPSGRPIAMIRELVAWLRWPEWKFCRECAPDEVCFVSMFPFGTQREHDEPSCKRPEELVKLSRIKKDNYWFQDGNWQMAVSGKGEQERQRAVRG